MNDKASLTSNHQLSRLAGDIAHCLLSIDKRTNVHETLTEVREELLKLAASPSETAGDDASDAAKWRAFRNCARIRMLGSAGFVHRENQYRFLTLEAWTQHDAQSSAEALDMLEEFVAVAQRCSPLEPSPVKAIPDPDPNERCGYCSVKRSLHNAGGVGSCGNWRPQEKASGLCVACGHHDQYHFDDGKGNVVCRWSETCVCIHRTESITPENGKG